MNTDWMERAKCKGREDIDFFPESGYHAAEAIEFCFGCPVRGHCLKYAIDNVIEIGVWGGVSANARYRYRRALEKA